VIFLFSLRLSLRNVDYIVNAGSTVFRFRFELGVFSWLRVCVEKRCQATGCIGIVGVKARFGGHKRRRSQFVLDRVIGVMLYN